MSRIFTTSSTLASSDRLQLWRENVASAYFELELEFGDAESFHGELKTFKLNTLSLSLLRSSALCYRRLVRHLTQDVDENYLLTVPELSDIQFSQRGRSIICPPGSFILERSGEPYEFLYGAPNALRVIKIPERALRLRVAAPDHLCAMRFDARDGAGALFTEFLALTTRHVDSLSSDAPAVISSQLLDLLGLALAGAQGLGESQETSVQAAHVRRVESYIRRRLGHADLSPVQVAQACGLSVRYLHRLFKSTGQTVTEHIRNLRLEACREALQGGHDKLSLGALAYQWGFSDQAHFCRVFKTRYGVSPGEARRLAAAERAPG